MKIVMDMSSYEIEPDDPKLEYDDEIMSAGWNPAVELVHMQIEEVESGEQQSKTAAILPVACLEEISGNELPDLIPRLLRNREWLH